MSSFAKTALMSCLFNTHPDIDPQHEITCTKSAASLVLAAVPF